MGKKTEILKQLLLLSTGEYYEINLSENVVPGIMYQVIDGNKYNINEKLNLPENAKYTDVIARWAELAPEEERKGFFDFFAIDNLISKYEKGQEHLCHRYWTKSVLKKPMMAEQHIFMYKDEEAGSLMGLTYLLDLTEIYKGEMYKKELETKLEKSSERLDTEKKYLEVLFRDYVLAYHLDVNEKNAEVLSLSKNSHVWTMDKMYHGAVFAYDEHIKDFAERFIVDGKELFVNMLSRAYIAKRMRTTTKYSFRMKCVPNVVGNRYYEVQVVRINPTAFDGRVIIVSEEIDNTVSAEEQHKAELNTERKYLEALTGDFVAVYHTNLKENQSTLIKVDSDIKGYDAERVSLRRSNNYSQRVEQYCAKYVVPEQRLSFRNSLSAENILYELSLSKKFVYRYQSIQNNSERRYYEVQALRMNDEPESSDVIIAFRDIDDVVTAEQRHQIALEERLEREINQNEVMTALGNSFCTIFKIDLKSDKYEKLRMSDDVEHFYINSSSASEVLNNLCGYVSPEHRERIRTFFDLGTLSERMKGKEAIEAECIATDDDWRRFRFIAKRRDNDGKLRHVLYVTQMVSAEKRREEQLISIAEAAKEANDAKTEFVSKVAHDIRTPMNSLCGFLQIAEANITNVEKLKYSLKKIRVAVEFLKELVNDVLDISKMENGKMLLKNKVINVKELFEELPTSIEGSDFGKKINFNYNIHDIICDEVIGDSLRLKQIYTNILSNAIKYTPDGGSVDFEVCEKESQNSDSVYLIVKIADTGIGMSDDFKERMFSKFERETDTRLNTVSGYGLGLTIVKQLVDLMNGEIDVVSRQGKGTVFTVKLHLLRADAKSNNAKTKNDFKSICGGMKILVAEDNELSREVIKELLEMNGVECDTVKDGKECVEILSAMQGAEYDAVLMDVQMPNMNGIDAATEIRALDNAAVGNIPIIAMTANALSADVQKCIDAGMNKHLAKPVDINKLLKALSELKFCGID